jgi:hypothetical protein
MAMQVTMIHEGLWRWAVPRGRFERASAYVEHGDAILLVDPVLPPEGDDRVRFAQAIARDIERLGGPVHVMTTRADDRRDTDALVSMTGGLAWAPGDDPPAGVEVIATGVDGHVAIWSPAHGALMPGTALTFEGGTMVAGPGVDIAPLLSLPARVVIPSIGPMTARGA